MANFRRWYANRPTTFNGPLLFSKAGLAMLLNADNVVAALACSDGLDLIVVTMHQLF